MSRATTFYASAVDRERVHSLRVVAGERRRIELDLDSLVPVGESVASVAWAWAQGSVAQALNPQLVGDSAFVSIDARNAGEDILVATVTLSDAQLRVERFAVRITGL